MRNPRLQQSLLGLLAIGTLALAGCSNPTAPANDAESTTGAGSETIVVSSANFVSSEVVGNVYAEALRAAGVDVETRFNIGSREAYVPALEDGSIDLIPDFTGNLLLFLDPEADVSSAEQIDTQLATVLEENGLTMLEPAPAEDKDALVVTPELAAEWDLTTIADLAAHNADLTIGGPPEFQERAVGLPGLEERYGVIPSEYVSIADGGGPATVEALLSGQVDAANIFTASASIPANNLIILEDPDFNFPSQNVVPVINSDKVTDTVSETLNAVSAMLTTDELIALNDLVTGDRKLEPQAAALEWLEEMGLL